MYGKTCLALGSLIDLPLALDRAPRCCNLELSTTFQKHAPQEAGRESRPRV